MFSFDSLHVDCAQSDGRKCDWPIADDGVCHSVRCNRLPMLTWIMQYNNCTLLVVHIMLVYKLPLVLSNSKVCINCLPCLNVTDYIRLIISFACVGNANCTADHLTNSHWYFARRVTWSKFPGELQLSQFLFPSALPRRQPFFLSKKMFGL